MRERGEESEGDVGVEMGGRTEMAVDGCLPPTRTFRQLHMTPTTFRHATSGLQQLLTELAC